MLFLFFAYTRSMSGTRQGGIKASKAIKKKFGKDYYKEIGRQGGLVGTTGGFASTVKGRDGLTGQERARIAGRKGGLKSKRGKKNKWTLFQK